MKFLLLNTLAAMLLLIMAGCSESSNEITDPRASAVEFGDCKFLDIDVSEIQETKDDCLKYDYDGKSRLSINHINAAFNCCPGNIYIEVNYEGNIITISEHELEASCDCCCLFDLSYDIDDISPGKYIIKVIEPYVSPSGEKLEFEADLTKATNGEYCVTRTGYPWDV